MKTLKLGASGIEAPVIIAGCMRLRPEETENFITASLGSGINMFDHADIYGRGECEAMFGRAVKNLKISRDKMILQSKCGIRPGLMYDFSYGHIIKSVEGSLKRLGTDYLDILLLHRPDALMEPDEVARAFTLLQKQGKVKFFGVSNFPPYETELLRRAVPLHVNQLQLSLMHACMIDSVLGFNRKDGAGTDYDRGVLSFCRLNNITAQAWSPLCAGHLGSGPFIGGDKYPVLNKALEETAHKYGCAPAAAAVAWILRHPAGIQAVIGTGRGDRVKELAAAADITLTREEWYGLFKAGGGNLP